MDASNINLVFCIVCLHYLV